MFSRVARMKRSSWILLGIGVGLVVAPVSALAAFTDVRVVGPFGAPQAIVTSANQLRTAEIDPAQIRHYRAGVGGTGCVGTPFPAGSSFMIKQLQIDAYRVNAPDAAATIYVYADQTCFGTPIAEVTPLSNRQDEEIPLDPGIPVKAGGGFGVRLGVTGMSAAVHLTGYLMPSGAVPASTPSAQAKGTSKEAATR